VYDGDQTRTPKYVMSNVDSELCWARQSEYQFRSHSRYEVIA